MKVSSLKSYLYIPSRFSWAAYLGLHCLVRKDCFGLGRMLNVTTIRFHCFRTKPPLRCIISQFSSLRRTLGIFLQELESFKAEIAFIHTVLAGGFHKFELDFDFKTRAFLDQERITRRLQLPPCSCHGVFTHRAIFSLN